MSGKGKRDRRAERLHREFLRSERGLHKLKRDLELYSVGFTWTRQKADGTRPAKLIGDLRGQIDQANREAGTPQHTGFQGAAFALTVIQPLYPFAVIEGGGVNPDGSWRALVWLDCSEDECKRRELAHGFPGEA